MNDTNFAQNEPIEGQQPAEPIETNEAAVPSAASAEPAPQNNETPRVDVEAALPPAMRETHEQATRQEHPAGEVFFRGSAAEVTDAEAEGIARRQLERSGLLRGQRVRVAD